MTMNSVSTGHAASLSDPVGCLRVAMVTNIPAPYRVPVYEALAADSRIEFKFFFCSGREPDRDWDLGAGRFEQLFFAREIHQIP